MRRWLIEPVLGVALLAFAPAGVMADPAPRPPAASATSPATPPAASPAAPLTVTRPDTDRMARREARRGEMLDANLGSVHAGLQLDASQDKLWPPVAEAMRGLDEARGFRFRRTLAAADTPIDGLRMQGDHMARMGAAMGRLADATKPFVASLTPDQKSRLPTLVQRMRPHKIVARAFDLPPDEGGSWGTGQGGGQMGGGRQGGGMGRQGGGMGGQGMGGQGMGGQGTRGPNGPDAGAINQQDRDDEE